MFKWITDRDKEVLKTIYYMRFITTKQLQQIHFKDIKYGQLVTTRRLQKLREHNLIKSYHRSNKDMIHTIDSDGVLIVAGLIGSTYNKLIFSSRKDLLSYGMAEHSIMLVEVYVKILEAAAAAGGKIIEFKVEQLNEESFEIQGQKMKFRPDIFLRYQPDPSLDRYRLFYIEVDNDTETPGAFKEKFKYYEGFFDSGIFQEKYSGLFPKVITLCNSQQRIHKLQQVTKTKLDWSYLLINDVGRIINGC